MKPPLLSLAARTHQGQVDPLSTKPTQPPPTLLEWSELLTGQVMDKKNDTPKYVSVGFRAKRSTSLQKTLAEHRYDASEARLSCPYPLAVPFFLSTTCWPSCMARPAPVTVTNEMNVRANQIPWHMKRSTPTAPRNPLDHKVGVSACHESHAAILF